MKTYPPAPPTAAVRLTDEERHKPRTLWFADGHSVQARVTRVEKDGIYIISADNTEFIKATDLCTVDRVGFGFGTRKESAWVARVEASEAQKKSVKLTPVLHV